MAAFVSGLSTSGFDLSDYEGAWSLHRQSTDGAEMLGQATITRDNEHYLYEESGELTLPTGERLLFNRTYCWVGDGATLRIFFDRACRNLFLHLIPVFDRTNYIGRASHKCGDDFYDAEFTFEGGQAFRTTYSVSGPRKDYVLTSEYRRSRG